ncbi:MAG TPA: hypothetical protein VND91_03400 [Candidatus Saccharimonadia bacterium]|nr:hypothetical protein [Candidatus Saccharimonadia bacterium]
MKFRSLLATCATACVAFACCGPVLAGNSGQTIVLESHDLRDDARDVKPKTAVTTEIPVSFEMRGKLRADGTVELICNEVGHGVVGPHEHRDGREEIR